MINVIGLGYIGLPTALMLASKGLKIVSTDYNPEVIDNLNKGELTFEEKGLYELYVSAKKNRIVFTSEYQKTDIYIVAVATPYDRNTFKVDASYVCKAVRDIMQVCPKNAIIIIESTVTPGTIDKYIKPIITEYNYTIGVDIHLVHAPERIIPGNMIFELENNSRTIGSESGEIGEKVKKIYESFCKGKIVLTDIRTAEFTKVVENTYRAVNIAFANELAKICRYTGLDVYEVIKICNMHPRVNILTPGPGVGGHCISVDPWFLVGEYPKLTNVISEALKVNMSMPEYVLERINEIMGEKGLKDTSRVGLYGLTYKENVDDYRDSPSLQLINYQKKHLAKPLKSYDPNVKKIIVENQYLDFDRFLEDIDFIVILVGHDHIKQNIDRIAGKTIFDTKKISDLPGTYRL